MSTALQGLDLIVYVRESGDTDWKSLVCDIDKKLSLTNDVTPIQTACGYFFGVQPVKGEVSGNAMYDVETGASSVSWQDAANWQIARTNLDFLIKNAAYTAENGDSITAGEVVHAFMTGKITKTELSGKVGEVVQFSYTFTPTGTPVLSGTSS
jgi:hypothetical protein